MTMKKFVMIILILVISMLLIACSKKIEPQNNITASENTTVSEETQENESVVITEPEEGMNDTMIPIENATEPENNETEENITEEEPITLPEEEPLAPSTDKCLEDLAEICAGPPMVDCVGMAEFDKSKKVLSFKAQNNLVDGIRLIKFYGYAEEGSWDCMTECDIVSVNVSVEGSEFEPLYYQTVLTGEIFEISVKCFQALEYISQGFKLEYSCADEFDCSGDLYYRVEALG